MADASSLADLVARRTGISISPQDHIQRRLDAFAKRRMHALGFSRMAEYLALLERGSVSDEFSRLIAALTNPQTSFFRDANHFRAFARLFEQLAPSRPKGLGLWSAGCATGEEPYSLAMLCQKRGHQAQILATDLNQDALALALQGHYHPWSTRQLPPEHNESFDRFGDTLAIKQDLRGWVEFRQHNLVEDQAPKPNSPLAQWDLILCRNVFIYFERDAIARVIEKMSQVLAPDGWLFLSAAESLSGLDVPLEVDQIEGCYAYRQRRRRNHPPRANNGLAEEGHDRSAPIAPFALAPAPAGPEPRWRTLLRSTEEVLADPQAAYEQATRLMDEEQFGRARSILYKIVGAYPERLVARLTLGNLLLRTHAFDEAMETFGAAHDIDPLQPETHYFQGVLYRKLGDHERAIGAFRRAVFLEPTFWCASFLLAGTCARLGKWDLCQRHLIHTLEHVHHVDAGQLFISHTRKMEDANLLADDVATHCERQLQLLGRPAPRQTGER